MNTPADPLAQLKNIHLPPPVSWWPPAPGWWLAALLAAALLGLAFRWLWRRWAANRYRRLALAALTRLEARRRAGHEPSLPLLREVAALLRRVAIARYGRPTVARLTGDQWLAFLDRTGNTDQFSTGPGRALGTMLYRPELEADTEAVCRLARRWIRRHRPC